MIKNFVSWLRDVSPFLAVIILWRLQTQYFNPGGILAIIPIFYYSFVRPINWMPLMAIIFCFLIDYNMDTKLFWTCAYCIAYAINGFQYFLDLQHADKNALVSFMIFMGAALFILMITNLSWIMIGRCLWVFIWVVALYLPITRFLKRVHGDD